MRTTDAELYPEIPVPHGCPVKHPKDHYGKRWATFSPKVKADRYAWFLQSLDNWKMAHEASVSATSTITSKITTIPKDLDPEWAAESAAWDAEFAEATAKWDDEDEVP